jgi:AMP-polyphosphate phosphotransferase
MSRASPRRRPQPSPVAMAIDLSEYEAAPKHDGDYGERLAALQKRLGQIQIAYMVHRRRAMIVFEGWDASGKGGTIQRLTAGWDPRAFEVFPVAAPEGHDAKRHYLARFWDKVPPDGAIHVFDRSWYGRVLVERVEGITVKNDWRRAYDEINEFEAQQRDSGTIVVKLFLHITAQEQDDRFRARLAHPWKRWKLTPDDLRNRAKRADYLAALDEMFANTDTRWAPWKVIDAAHKKYARLTALEHIATALEKGVPMTPPEADLSMMAAAKALGLLAEA